MDQSPFNKLAAELRNRIYKFALIQKDPIRLQCNSDGDMARMPRHLRRKNKLAVTSMCKQMRNESLPIFLENNYFRFEGKHDFKEHEVVTACYGSMLCWMTRLGSWASYLRFVGFEICDDAFAIGWPCLRPDHLYGFALKRLRNVFDIPNLRLTVELTGNCCPGPRMRGYSWTASFNFEHGAPVSQLFSEDLKDLEARIKADVDAHTDKASDILIGSAMEEFKDMQEAVTLMVKDL